MFLAKKIAFLIWINNVDISNEISKHCDVDIIVIFEKKTTGIALTAK